MRCWCCLLVCYLGWLLVDLLIVLVLLFTLRSICLLFRCAGFACVVIALCCWRVVGCCVFVGFSGSGFLRMVLHCFMFGDDLRALFVVGFDLVCGWLLCLFAWFDFVWGYWCG